MPPALEKWGICRQRSCISSATIRRLQAGKQLPAQSLATANTHDLPPIAAYWKGVTSTFGEVGLIPTDEDADRVRAERDRTSGARAMLEREPGSRRRSEVLAELWGGVRGLRTPARLVGLSLDDLAGEIEPVNARCRRDKFPS